MAPPVLEIRDLRVSFPTDDGPVQAVRGIDLDGERGRAACGIVGESGSGKSVTFLAAMGLLPQSAKITGSVQVRGQELIGRQTRTIRAAYGARRSP